MRLSVEEYEPRVVPSNIPPVAVNDSYGVHQGQMLSISTPAVLANDSDANGDPLNAELVSSVSHGYLMLEPDGSFYYEPNSGFVGIDSFTYRAFDGTEYSNVATVTLQVTNQAPVAVPDSYIVSEEMLMLSVSTPGVLTNDSDEDGDLLTVELVSSVGHGYLMLESDGSFYYEPQSGFAGTDSFTYRVFDGAAYSNPATVTLSVVRPPPVANNDSYSVLHDRTLIVSSSGVLDNDSDPSSLTLTAELVSGPVQGSLTLNGDGSFTYTPNQYFVGADSFTYRVTNGGAISNVATVALTVTNTAPAATGDSYDVSGETTLIISAPGVLANDSDADEDTLTVVLASGPMHGSLTLAPDGSFQYTPEQDYRGIDSFSYFVTDGIVASLTVLVDLRVLQRVHVWDGEAGDNNWSSALNWDTNLVPANGDSVIFNETSDKASTQDIVRSLEIMQITAGYEGSLSLEADLTITEELDLSITAEVLGCGMTLTLASTATGFWRSGALGGQATFHVGSGATLHLASETSLTLEGWTLENYGTIWWTSGRFVVKTGAVVKNERDADFNVLEDDRLEGDGAFYNRGKFRKLEGATEGTPRTDIRIDFFNEGSGVGQGLVEVLQGTLAFQGNGEHSSIFRVAEGATILFGKPRIHELRAGTTFEGPGKYEVRSATLLLEPLLSLSPAWFDLGNDATVEVMGGGLWIASLQILEKFSWRSSVFKNGMQVRIAETATGTLLGEGLKILDNSMFENQGTITWSDGGLVLLDMAAFTNAGTFYVTSGGTIYGVHSAPVFAGWQLFTNTGNFLKTAGTITTIRSRFENVNGLLDVDHYSIYFLAGLVQQGANARTVLDSGSITVGSIDTPGTFRVEGGFLTGRGTISGNLYLDAHWDLGSAYGIMTINGNLTLDSQAYLYLRVGGTEPGVLYDQIVVSGAAALGGTLHVIPDYQPDSTDLFVLLDTNAAISSQFTDVLSSLLDQGWHAVNGNDLWFVNEL